MRKLHLSPAAAEDLENILYYTMYNWGKRQFNVYLASFQETFDSLLLETETPLSRKRGDLFPDCRSIQSGHHVVFYRLIKGDIEIIRVLHEKMDFSRHFEE